VEDVCDVREERAPALAVCRISRSGGGGGSSDGLMWNHIATDCEADLGKFMRKRSYNRGGTVAMGTSEDPHS
jgi:hypothetical protein